MGKDWEIRKSKNVLENEDADWDDFSWSGMNSSLLRWKYPEQALSILCIDVVRSMGISGKDGLSTLIKNRSLIWTLFQDNSTESPFARSSKEPFDEIKHS